MLRTRACLSRTDLPSLDQSIVPLKARPDSALPSPHSGFGQFEPTLERCEVRLALSAIPFLPFDGDLIDFQQDPAFDIAPVTPIAPELSSFQGDADLPMQIQLNRASSFGLAGQGQTVAVIDSGIAYDHQALGRGYGENHRVVGGWDFAENDNLPYDDGPGGYHGTHVAGIIGSDMPGRLGIAPAVDFVALRVFDDFGKSNIEWTEAALKWVYDHRDSFANPITTVNLSLGASWNSVTPPSWASLEEELGDLNRAGIVVVVSAGNSFQQHLEPGLAYPAASPFTIPVGSLDADGGLSDFSQRDTRILAAPGRNVESAVPDFFYGKDGVINDWAKSSGTSMATPFVTGAAVLVREAYELTGETSVSPEQIYNTLRESAGQIFDSITNQYYKTLDIESAIRSILPEDKVPDTWGNASVSEAQAQWKVDGWINSSGDQDVYRYRATQSGEVSLRFESQSVPLESIQFLKDGRQLEPDELLSGTKQTGELKFRVSSGEEFGFIVNGSKRIGSFSVEGSIHTSDSQTPNAHGEHAATASNGQNNNLSMAPLSVPDFVKQIDNTLFVSGTATANQIKVDLSRGMSLELDGEIYRLDNASVNHIVIDGAQSKDSISILGSPGSEMVEMRLGETRITNEQFELEILNVEQIQFTGGGGADRVYLYDADTDDRLESYPNKANLRGVGYDFVVDDTSRIFVHATRGGDDQAFVYDSLGNDVLTVRPQFASLTGEGYFNYLAGFERVYAYGNQGGIDFASIYDSSGNDLFSSSGTSSSITGEGFSTFVRGYENVEAYSQAGGMDQAKIYITSEHKVHQSTGYVGVQFSNQFSNQFATARYFELVDIQQQSTQLILPSSYPVPFNESPQPSVDQVDISNIIKNTDATERLLENHRSVYQSGIAGFTPPDSVYETAAVKSQPSDPTGTTQALHTEDSFESLAILMLERSGLAASVSLPRNRV